MAKITVGLLRELENQCNKGFISYSRMVELLNERAFDTSGEVPKDCILKADILAHLDKMIEDAEAQERIFKDNEMEISEFTSGAMKIAYKMVKNWVVRQNAKNFVNNTTELEILKKWIAAISISGSGSTHTDESSRNVGEYIKHMLKPKRIPVPWPKSAYWEDSPDWALARGVDALGRCVFIGIEPNKSLGGFTIKQEECGRIPLLQYSQWEQSLELHPSL